jgi:hypothetical protein
MRREPILSAFVVLVLSLAAAPARADHGAVGFGVEVAGPITTLAASPLPRGLVSVGISEEYLSFSTFSDDQLRAYAAQGEEDVHSLDYLSTTSIGVSWGAAEWLTLSGRLPYVVRGNIRAGEVEGTEPEAHSHGDAKGLGDAVVLARMRVLHRPDARIAAAIISGLKTPTGKTDVSSGGERLETHLQPGSGAWDPLVGVAVSRASSAVSVYVGILYDVATDGAQDTNLGDAAFYSASLTYRALGRSHEHPHEHGEEHHHDSDHEHGEMEHEHVDHAGTALDVLLEFGGDSRQKTAVAGVDDDNTGGTRLYLSPGVRVSGAGRWGAFVSVGIPVVENHNGIQDDAKYRISAGAAIGF